MAAAMRANRSPAGITPMVRALPEVKQAELATEISESTKALRAAAAKFVAESTKPKAQRPITETRSGAAWSSPGACNHLPPCKNGQHK